MKLLDLPLELFRHIMAYAIPEEASDLDINTFRAYHPTMHLLLVSKAFCSEVKLQLFKIRPLKIRIFDNDLLHDLTHGDRPDLTSIHRHMTDLRESNRLLALPSLRSVLRLHFRRVHIHFIPLLAPVNVGSGLELDYFKSAYPHQPPEILLANYKNILDLQHHIILDLARDISKCREEIEDSHSAISTRHTTFKLFFHDDPNEIIPSHLLPNTIYTIPRAPIKHLSYLPRPAPSTQNPTALFPTTPNLPMWSPMHILSILDHFNCIYYPDYLPDRPSYPSFDDTISLPSTLAVLQHDTTKSTAWHHNYWRQRIHHAFTHPDDAEVNHDMSGDTLLNWYSGKTMVRPRGWGTAREPIKIHPRLVLIDLEDDVLRTEGCKCPDKFVCAVCPERAGCETCRACKAPSNGVTFPSMQGQGISRDPKAYEVFYPSACVRGSALARRQTTNRHLVEKAAKCQDFNQRLKQSRTERAEFVFEQEAMAYIVKDWEAELLLKAVPKGELREVKKRLSLWKAFFERCRQVASERWMYSGIEMLKDLEIAEGTKLTKEQKFVVRFADREYKEDVRKAKKAIRVMIGGFMNRVFDEDAVVKRMTEEQGERAVMKATAVARIERLGDDSDEELLSEGDEGEAFGVQTLQS